MTDADLTPEQIRDRITWLQDVRRQGTNALHSRAAFQKPPTCTDAESAAIARKKLTDREGKS